MLGVHNVYRIPTDKRGEEKELRERIYMAWVIWVKGNRELETGCGVEMNTCHMAGGNSKGSNEIEGEEMMR